MLLPMRKANLLQVGDIINGWSDQSYKILEIKTEFSEGNEWIILTTERSNKNKKYVYKAMANDLMPLRLTAIEEN